MKFIIASTIVPFIEGGGTFIVDWLEKKLVEFGHQVEVFKIPFEPNYKTMIQQMLALRLMNLGDNADRLIAIRTPSYLIKHHHKIIWFIHHHREAYDLWESKYNSIPKNAEGIAIRNSIVKADNLAFSEAKKIITNSKIVSKRLYDYNGFSSKVVYPPLLDSSNFYCQSFKDYIFYPSRITLHKRQHLLVEAMKYTKTPIRLIIAGKPDSIQNHEHLLKLIKSSKVKQKITLIDRWISESEKQKIMSNALAVAYVPYLEDSYGYVSLEGFASKKPILTCSDSGGTNEIIVDKSNGLISRPTPKALAEAMDYIYQNKQIAKKMGIEGFRSPQKLKINWENVISELVN